MAEPEELEHPPIREAIIDFRVPRSASLEVGAFASVWPDLEDEYPQSYVQHALVGGRLDLDDGEEGAAALPPEVSITGVARRSEDELRTAQFRLDGFTFNRVGHYPGWDQVFGEARRLWNLYASVAKPATVERVATRFINDMELPFPVDFADFLDAPPKIPGAWPQRVIDFLTRFTLVDEETGLTAHVTLTPSQVTSDKVVLIFDIDAFKKGPFDPEGEDLWETFESLRSLKNTIFFGGLTEKAMELLRGPNS